VSIPYPRYMSKLVMRAIKTMLIVASCVAVLACGDSGGGGEIDTARSEDVLATIDTPEKGTTCPCTIWPHTVAPQEAADSDSSPVNVGVKFTTEVSGYVTGIRFYKGTGNSGTHVGSLWSSSGQLLARADFTDETAVGWQTVS